MACDLIGLGRKEPCKDQVGGIQEVYFINFGDLGTPTYDVTDTDVITGFSELTINAYKYEVRGSSTFTQNIQSSKENGTTAFEQVLELTLKRLSKEDHKEIKNIAYSRPHVVVKDYNGNLFMSGLENGLEVTAGTIVTGTNFNDLSGYTLTLSGMERVPANFLADLSAFTVTEGA